MSPLTESLCPRKKKDRAARFRRVARDLRTMHYYTTRDAGRHNIPAHIIHKIIVLLRFSVKERARDPIFIGRIDIPGTSGTRNAGSVL